MSKQFHILNGDALKEQFPRDIKGEVVVVRECLIEGPVDGGSLEEIFKTRAEFISQTYKDHSDQNYDSYVASEFRKIQNIPEDSEVNFWFEEDLFCQINFWFALHVLFLTKKNHNVYLVKPRVHNQYGFGGLDKQELMSIFKERVSLNNQDKLAGLWTLYQNEDIEKLLEHGAELSTQFPFILRAIQAHIARIPSSGNLGQPIKSLLQIMKDLQTDDFQSVFTEFQKRESIYGFGDSQVKRLMNQIKDNDLT